MTESIDDLLTRARDYEELILAEDIDRLCNKIEILRAMIASVHPRVWKLVANQREFIVIGEHEPYYMDAYAMIRQHEMSKGTWIEKDRLAYMAACFHKMEMER